MKEGARSDWLECPGCGGSSFSTGPEGRFVCDYCQRAYTPSWPVCPICGAQNLPTAHRCIACGHDLGVLDAVFARATGEAAHWLRKAREEAAAIKAREEEASQARLAEMWAIEQRRREELARAQAERDRQMRILWEAVVIFAFIVVVIVIVVILSGQAR